jgi:hypothetical protein
MCALRAFQKFWSRKSVHFNISAPPPITFVGKLAIFGPPDFQILATPLQETIPGGNSQLIVKGLMSYGQDGHWRWDLYTL